MGKMTKRTGYLEDDQVRLRALEPEDLEFLYNCENDSSLWEFGSTLAPFSRYILSEYIENSHQSLYESRQLRLILELREARETIGLLDLFDFDPHNRRAACGILVAQAYQGKGFGSRGMALLVDYAFSFLGLRQVYVHIPAHNIACLHLCEHCGFERTAVLKDWVVTGNRHYTDVYVLQRINSSMDL